jgi:hypothetical protein
LFNKRTEKIVNISGGGCPDVPYFHACLVGKNLEDSPENKVSLGFVEGLNNKIRVIQRRAYGLCDEEYLRLKILTCMLKEI